MTDVYKCAVVEDVVLVTEVAKLLNFAVLGASTVVVTDFVGDDGAPTLVVSVVASDFVGDYAYSTAVERAQVKEAVELSFDRSVDEYVTAFDAMHYTAPYTVEDMVEVTESLELNTSLLASEQLYVRDTVQAGVAISGLASDSVTALDSSSGSASTLVGSAVDVKDATFDSTTVSLSSTVVALDVTLGAAQTDIAIQDVVVAGGSALATEQASVVENLVLSVEVEAVSSFLLTDSARASEHLALGTAITQQTTEHVSASVVLVGYDANVVEEWLTAVDTQESVVRAQGQLRSEAIAQDQPVGEVDRGYFVHDQLVASESLHVEISAPLEVLVLANDHVGLGFEAVAPEMVGDTYATAEMAGQGVVHAQALEVVMAMASVEFLVGTTSGVYEMLAVEHITVYDRVEVVEALDSFAWVMNSQSLAHSYYDGFVDFNSAVQLGNRAFMLSPSGLYELGGDSDDGKIIEAEVVTGQMDFGTIDRKRVEQFDLGYTAAGDLQAVVSCEGFAPSEPQTLEAREMRTAHTSRIRVGKGMVGRYWKLELKNREGAGFELFNVQTKVALSTRRMR